MNAACSTVAITMLAILMYLQISLVIQNETLIAIKAPHGTTLEVPDPDEVCLSI